MKSNKHLEVARSYVDSFNERDWDRLSGMLAPNAVYDEVGTGRKLKGRKEIVSTAEAWTKSFPDAKGTIENTIVSDDTVVLEITYRGTHKGELTGPTGPVAATGKKISTRAVEVFRISDGLIVESRNYFDMLSMLQAVGALPSQAAKRAGA